MTNPDVFMTNPVEGDDQPIFPPNLFETSTWSLQDLKHLQEVGKGKDTVIYSATCPRLAGKIVAVKVYDRQKLPPTKLRAIKREIAMMMFFSKKKVPNVVDFHCAFQDDNYYYIVMEYCSGGDLLEKLLRDKRAMSERRAAVHVARPLLMTLSHLHGLRIIHRDIKLENIFLDGNGCVRLGDFGLTMSMAQEAAISPVGTIEYMAPEVVALPPVDMVMSGKIRASSIAPTDEKVDIWAMGVTLYELVTGRLPFEGRDKAEIKNSISSYRLAAFPSFVSPKCQGMIRAMLSFDPKMRPSAKELLSHPYMQMYCNVDPHIPLRASTGMLSLDVRAGPLPESTMPSSHLQQHQSQQQQQQHQQRQIYHTANQTMTTTPAAPLAELPQTSSVASREASMPKFSPSAWAQAIRRFSVGQKLHPDDGGAVSSRTTSSTADGTDDGDEDGVSPKEHLPGGKLLGKMSLRNLFTNRKSSPHPSSQVVVNDQQL